MHPHALTALTSKGRVIRCTVPGLTPNRSAILRTPGRPGVARACLMRASSSGAIGVRRRLAAMATSRPIRTTWRWGNRAQKNVRDVMVGRANST